MRLPAHYRRDYTLNYDHEYVHEECTGIGKRLYVKYCSKNGQLGWLYHCFSCQNSPNGLRGFHPADRYASPLETIKLVRILQSPDNPYRGEQSVQLPADFTTRLDMATVKYLAQYQINPECAKRYGIGYSACLDRMIIPVYAGARLVSYQSRTFKPYTKYNPKYITVQAKDIQYCIYRPIKAPNTKQLVLVESALSVIKLGSVVDCFGLLGSSLNPTLYPYLQAKEILIWLDPDKVSESIRFAKSIREFVNPNVKSILTKRKPKCYNLSMVELILKGEKNYEDFIF